MKKRNIIICIISIIILILVMVSLTIIIKKNISKNKINYISDTLETNFENCIIEYDEDTHGGFLGDGDYFAKIICTEDVNGKIQSNWNKLPLPEEIQVVMNMIQCNKDGCYSIYDQYNIPRTENGYYYFYDRHSDSTDRTNSADLNNRSSYNFSIGIYDSQNKILYYYELDT